MKVLGRIGYMIEMLALELILYQLWLNIFIIVITEICDTISGRGYLIRTLFEVQCFLQWAARLFGVYWWNIKVK